MCLFPVLVLCSWSSIQALLLGQYCGKGVTHGLAPNVTGTTRSMMECVALCDRESQCSGINYIDTESGGRNGLCQLYLYDTVSPCYFTNNTQNGGYWRKKQVMKYTF